MCVSLTDSDPSSLTSADVVETEEEESGEDFSTAAASTSFWLHFPCPWSRPPVVVSAAPSTGSGL